MWKFDTVFSLPSFARKAALAVAVAGLALAGSGPAARADTTLGVGKASAETFAFAPVHIGSELGVFKKHGLDVTITDFAGGSRLQQGLAADVIDIGLGSGPEMASIPAGSPVKAVAMFMGPPAMLVLLARNDGSVPDVEALKGRKVAVTQLNALTAWLVKRTSIALGWGPDGMENVAVGDDRSRLAALRSRQVDAIVINPGAALEYERSGDGKIVVRFPQYVPKFHNHVIYASDKIIAENPEAVRAFVAGFLETIAWMRDNKEQSVEMSKGIMGVDTEIGSQVYDEAMPAFSTDGRFDTGTMEMLAESWVEQGTLPEKPDIHTLYTEEFLP